jgi:hypothetical protein
LIATLLPIALLGAVFLAMLDAERRTALDHATGRAASVAGMATRQYIGEELGGSRASPSPPQSTARTGALFMPTRSACWRSIRTGSTSS